ncbi:MAG: hypothetical protein KIT57_17055 [Blastocatellales bacterium]|nr:hypothetical protein [Blastocatellales bacterium]
MRRIDRKLGVSVMFVASVAPLIANSHSKSLLVNTLENARPTFDNVVTDRLQGMVDTNFFYKRVTDDSDFSYFFLDWLFDRFRRSLDVA